MSPQCHHINIHQLNPCAGQALPSALIQPLAPLQYLLVLAQRPQDLTTRLTSCFLHLPPHTRTGLNHQPRNSLPPDPPPLKGLSKASLATPQRVPTLAFGGSSSSPMPFLDMLPAPGAGTSCKVTRKGHKPDQDHCLQTGNPRPWLKVTPVAI